MGPLVLSAGVAGGPTAAVAVLTVGAARTQLSGVTRLADLTGSAAFIAPREPVGPARGDIRVAVIGDSTATGVGNAPKEDPSEEDVACERSADAHTQILASATGWSVASMACASAMIPEGLLGAQPRRPGSPPPQVGVLKSIASLRAVVASLGANDIGWSDLVRYCHALPRYDDQASDRLMRSCIDAFRLQNAQLLQQLSDLSARPEVVVTSYYDAFGETFDCPALRDPAGPSDPVAGYGFSPDADDPTRTLRQEVQPLRSVRAKRSDVLGQGAEVFGFTSVEPSFAGHGLCSEQPWVQGLSQAHPFNPDAAGHLAIAAAQLPQLVLMAPA